MEEPEDMLEFMRHVTNHVDLLTVGKFYDKVKEPKLIWSLRWTYYQCSYHFEIFIFVENKNSCS
jgi:hypothetical protein